MQNETPKFDIRQSPGFLINMMARRTSHLLQKVFRENGYNITAPQWSVLNLLWQEEGMIQSRLAEGIFSDRHTISRVIRLMEKQGLVYKKPDEQDKRAFRVYLTDQGKHLQSVLPPLALKTAGIAFANVSPEDVTTLIKILDTISDNIDIMSQEKEASCSALR